MLKKELEDKLIAQEKEINELKQAIAMMSKNQEKFDEVKRNLDMVNEDAAKMSESLRLKNRTLTDVGATIFNYINALESMTKVLKDALVFQGLFGRKE